MECVQQLNFIKPRNSLSKPPIIQVPFTQKHHRNGSHIPTQNGPVVQIISFLTWLKMQTLLYLVANGIASISTV